MLGYQSIALVWKACMIIITIEALLMAENDVYSNVVMNLGEVNILNKTLISLRRPIFS